MAVLLVFVMAFSTIKRLHRPEQVVSSFGDRSNCAGTTGLRKSPRVFRRKLPFKPHAGLTRGLLAGAYLAEGRQALVDEAWDEAVHYLEQSQKLQPNAREPRSFLARAYLYRSFHRYNAGDLVGAEEDCLRGVALNQRIEGFHYILGAVYYQQERWTEAIQELEMVLQINPENQAAQALLVELRKQVKVWSSCLP